MVSLNHGTPLSKVFWIGRSSLISRDYEMKLCRRRPAWVKDQAHQAVPHRLWALSLTRKSKRKEKRKKDGKKNLDVSKVKCFICHKQGHFASQCPDKKNKSNTQMVESAEIDEFSKNFNEEFCLIACMANTTGSSIWYIDSGASSHMTGQKKFFKDLQECGIGIHVELGDKRRELALFH